MSTDSEEQEFLDLLESLSWKERNRKMSSSFSSSSSMFDSAIMGDSD